MASISATDFIEALGKIHSTTNRTEHITFVSHLEQILDNFQPDDDTRPYFTLLIQKYLPEEDQIMYI